MNLTPTEAEQYVQAIKGKVDTDKVEVVLCVPFTTIHAVQNAVKGTNIKVAAQNMHYMDQGAYTGEISGTMLKDMGVPYVIIGHSERRERFAESDLIVNLKVLSALKHGITPIICVGESQRQNREDRTKDVLRKQIKFAVDGLTCDEATKLVIAYEPIWAIGTGVTPTKEEAEKTCAFIRTRIERIYNKETADAVTILYGGSVDPGNADDMFSQPNIDGGLIGGASLPKSPALADADLPFVKLVEAGIRHG